MVKSYEHSQTLGVAIAARGFSAIAGKFTVSRITEKTLLMVTPIFFSKNNVFEPCYCT